MKEQTDDVLNDIADKELDRWLSAQPLLPSSPSFCNAVMSEIEQRQPLWKRLTQKLWKPRIVQWNIPGAVFSFTLALALGFSLALFSGIQTKQSELAQVLPYDMQPGMVSDHRLVQFEFQAPQAEHVELVGDFSQWQKKIPMIKTSNGVWVVEIALDDGSYEYAFVVDKARLIQDPDAKVLRDDGFGNRNAVRTVTSI